MTKGVMGSLVVIKKTRDETAINKNIMNPKPTYIRYPIGMECCQQKVESPD